MKKGDSFGKFLASLAIASFGIGVLFFLPFSLQGNAILGVSSAPHMAFYVLGIIFIMLGIFFVIARHGRLSLLTASEVKPSYSPSSFREVSGAPLSNKPLPVLVSLSFFEQLEKQPAFFTSYFSPSFFKGFSLCVTDVAKAEIERAAAEFSLPESNLFPYIEKFISLSTVKPILGEQDFMEYLEEAQISFLDLPVIESFLVELWAKYSPLTQDFSDTSLFDYLLFGILRGEQVTFILSEDPTLKKVARFLSLQGLSYNGQVRKANIQVFSLNELIEH